jgi:two-component system, OmpR family, response regulator
MSAGGPAMLASREACGRSRVLVVDDDSDVVQLLAVSLKFVGFEVDTAADGPEALTRAREWRPDAVLLELTMPGMDGLTVLSRLRAAGVGAPVLFVTGRDALEDKIRGLTAGADDYITKPFDLEEVVARLRVVLRRTKPTGEDGDNRRPRPLKYADLVLDENSHEVWKADDPITLSPTEFELLRYFLINAETVLSKKTILSHMRPGRPNANWKAVESYVSLLRRKVDRVEKPLLHTLRGRGYILREHPAQRRYRGTSPLA